MGSPQKRTTSPGAGDHQTRTVGIEGETRLPGGCLHGLLQAACLAIARRGRPSAPEVLLLFHRGMERFLEGEIEVHRARPVVGLTPGLSSQIMDGDWEHAIKTGQISTATPATHWNQKRLLIHRLVGTAVLETQGPIGAEQQQRQAGAIGLHGRRQQVGNGGTRGGDHGAGTATRGREPERMKGGGALIDGGDESEQTCPLEPPSGMG